jgi:hypothetical protein
MFSTSVEQKGAVSPFGYTLFILAITKIAHFISRFMRCSQNTVVFLMGSIQHRILCTKNWQEQSCKRWTMGHRIHHTQKNEMYNHHEYLTKIRKSEKGIKCSQQYDQGIEASMDYNYKDFTDINRLVPNIWQRLHETSIHMKCGGEYCFLIKPFGIIVQMIIFYFKCAYISLSFMPIFL